MCCLPCVLQMVLVLKCQAACIAVMCTVHSCMEEYCDRQLECLFVMYKSTHVHTHQAGLFNENVIRLRKSVQTKPSYTANITLYTRIYTFRLPAYAKTNFATLAVWETFIFLNVLIFQIIVLQYLCRSPMHTLCLVVSTL